MPFSLQLKKMSRPEKLKAMEELWTDLSKAESNFKSPGWHADKLKEAEQLVASGKAKFEDWDIAKVRIAARARKL